MSVDYKEKFEDVDKLMEAIDGMPLGALRIFAREEFEIVPGAKKRGELIEIIRGVYLGNEPPQRKKSGRPPRSSKMEQDLPEIETDEFDEEKQEDPIEEDVYCGILEIMPDGFGFLRTNNYSSSPNKDIYVPPTQIKRFNLRTGDKLKCKARLFPDRSAPSVIFIYEINDMLCANAFRRTPFESLLPCHPDKRLTLEMDKNEYALRAIDLVAPIGKGQRGLIVAPPKTGKTILLKKIAQAIRHNHPDVYLTVLLIDERPEEVTDFKQSVDCDVVYSTFDQTAQHHTQIAELVLANAKRRVELGQDVMILMDSITRLARAYNQTAELSGRTLTGGLDSTALQEPKKLFGAGRNVKNGGSLTILATALIDTGSRMDDIIYEEFKGTGNMEIHLDRRMSEKRIFPAIDLNRSSTRREELLLTTQQMEGMYLIRKSLSGNDPVAATEELLDMLTCTSSNAEFIETLRLITKKKFK
ncbi:MAG: transcription termination factor Rho [Corallococcus sp.]|nr:transcription termination factor Rho [Corallococcus sp.]